MLSKWCCMLTVVCLPVILLSPDADAKPTVDDESSQRGSASLQEVANMVRVIASNQQEMKDGIQQNVVEMRKMKDEMKNESDRVTAEMEDVKRLVLSRPTECECATVKPTEYSTYPTATTSTSPPEHSTVQPSKRQLVSALVCEYAVCFWSPFVERLFSVCDMLTTGRRNRMRKSLRMRSWLKVNYNEICDLQ